MFSVSSFEEIFYKGLEWDLLHSIAPSPYAQLLRHQKLLKSWVLCSTLCAQLYEIDPRFQRIVGATFFTCQQVVYGNSEIMGSVLNARLVLKAH